MESGERLSTESYKGVRDFYPEDWAKLEAVFAMVRKVLREYGYEEYNASPLERAELYERKTSEEIVNEQTYTFTDRGDRKVTLRPEMTPTLARMVAARRRELVFPLRWFSIPNVFRYERPQRGRLREHYQVNVDMLGIDDVRADGEILVIADAILRAFGAKDEDFVIKLGSRPLLDAACRAAGFTTQEDIDSYRRLLDRKAKMPAEEFEKALEGRPDPVALIESSEDEAVAKEREDVNALIEAFKARGMTNVIFDPTVVRGFDYYTGLVFEVFDTNPENNRSLFGGGRYDNLLSLFGSELVPAVGFGMGDVTLVDFLETHGLMPKVQSAPTLYVGTPSEGDIHYAQEFAEELRAAGISVLVNVTNKALGDQIKEAVRRHIPFFVAVGAEEATKNVYRLKALDSSEEETLPLEGVVARVR